MSQNLTEIHSEAEFVVSLSGPQYSLRWATRFRVSLDDDARQRNRINIVAAVLIVNILDLISGDTSLELLIHDYTCIRRPEFECSGPQLEGPEFECSGPQLEGPEFECSGPQLEGPEFECSGPQLEGPEFEYSELSLKICGSIYCEILE
ncbi:hypothetical protein ANN_08255 [Periplaneta americana]|uniref:Uncharacterized protein n=1 Tax=Periplaneta americana TaxID=6978 RepID=A0ABQ8T2A0_PERAM|nr:hypothetical protein ANN_08255 [Periplaneta americana]